MDWAFFKSLIDLAGTPAAILFLGYVVIKQGRKIENLSAIINDHGKAQSALEIRFNEWKEEVKNMGDRLVSLTDKITAFWRTLAENGLTKRD